MTNGYFDCGRTQTRTAQVHGRSPIDISPHADVKTRTKSAPSFFPDTNCSKRNLQPEPYSPTSARLHVRIRKASAFSEQPGIVDERVNGRVIRMIERIQVVHMKLDLQFFRDVGGLENGKVEEIGVIVAQCISPYIAKRRSEDLSSRSSVSNEMHLLYSDDTRWVLGVRHRIPQCIRCCPRESVIELVQTD